MTLDEQLAEIDRLIDKIMADFDIFIETDKLLSAASARSTILSLRGLRFDLKQRYAEQLAKEALNETV